MRLLVAHIWASICIVAVALAVMASTTGAGEKGNTSLAVEAQGSFFVGGSSVTALGTFDSTHPYPAPDDGQNFRTDQMYVQYQIPPDERSLPIIFVHGAGQTGKTWESTPDGREGFQTIFTRRGHAVYIVDFPRRGRAGFPSFNGPLGALGGKQQIPDLTTRLGDEEAFILFRLGPRYGEYFANTAFPKTGLDQFLRQMVPFVEDDTEVITNALSALLDKTGPAILVTHSQSGPFGWLTAVKNRNVKAIIAYEPAGFVFPREGTPNILPLSNGVKLPTNLGIPSKDFQRLVKIPIQIVWGDNIPRKPTSVIGLDIWRVQCRAAEGFAAAVNAAGGDVSNFLLSKAGLNGNSHFPFADLNNALVADLLTRFLQDKKLGGKEAKMTARTKAR